MEGYIIGWERQERFRYEWDNGDPPMVWDITKAKELVACQQTIGTEPKAIDHDAMIVLDQGNVLDDAVVAKADPSVPGIAAPIVDTDKQMVIYVLIDGQHRLRKALRTGQGFTAWLLTDAAARACTIEGPAHRMPWNVRAEPPPQNKSTVDLKSS